MALRGYIPPPAGRLDYLLWKEAFLLYNDLIKNTTKDSDERIKGYNKIKLIQDTINSLKNEYNLSQILLINPNLINEFDK